jgi:hypothetical protein
MTANTTLHTRVHLSRKALLALLAAVLAASVCWAVLTFGTSTSTPAPAVRMPAEPAYVQAIAALPPEQIAAAFGTDRP